MRASSGLSSRLGSARDKVYPTPIAVEVGSFGPAQHAGSAVPQPSAPYRREMNLCTMHKKPPLLPLPAMTRSEFTHGMGIRDDSRLTFLMARNGDARDTNARKHHTDRTAQVSRF